jgi:hypothetical protein
VSDQLLELARARAEDFRELARLRVGLLAAGRLVAGLDEADRQAAALLASRLAALAALDGKVARLVGYDDARANYARLQEIPVRLREHAQAVQRVADQAIEALRRLDEQAREADGIPPLEAARASERARLDAIDARIEETAATYQRLQDEKAAFAAGEDETYRKAVEYLVSELRREDLRALRRDAQATPFPEDDLVIARLLDREQQEQALQVSLGELKRASQQHLARLQQIESLRADFKRRQYDRGDSVFADGSLLGVMLANFLSGLLDRDGLWRVLEQQQRYRPQRDELPEEVRERRDAGALRTRCTDDDQDPGDRCGDRASARRRGGGGGRFHPP